MNSPAQPVRAQRPAKVWLLATLIQLIAWLFVFTVVFVSFHFKFMTAWSFMQMAIFQGILASFISRRLKQPIWWFLIHLMFSPLIVFFLTFDVSSGIYLAIFIVLALMFWSTFKTRVPFFLTNQQTEIQIVELITQYQPAQFLDLGCASGGLLRCLSQHFPEIQFIGFEIAPLPYLMAKFRLRKQNNAHVFYGDFWELDFGNYDFIYAFLSDEPMIQLWQKVLSEMKLGSVFVSNTFEVPGVTADKTIDIEDFRGTKLLFWKMNTQPQPETSESETVSLNGHDQNRMSELV